MGRPITNLMGKRFGKLEAVEFDRTDGSHAYWKCICECGRTVSIRSINLVNGNTRSCGCHKGRTTHGMAYSETYKSWKNMKQRCLNPNNTRFDHYGGRGISVCKEWMDFDNFLRDMGECSVGMTLERVDNDGDYSPTNCKWIHWSEQNKNRGKFNSHSKIKSEANHG